MDIWINGNFENGNLKNWIFGKIGIWKNGNLKKWK